MDVRPAPGKILAGQEDQVFLGEALRLLNLLPVVIATDQGLVHRVVQIVDAEDLHQSIVAAMLQIHDVPPSGSISLVSL
jgi:hypothetical protein